MPLAVYPIDTRLLPPRVEEAIAQLHLALQEETDYRQAQVNFQIAVKALPEVVVVVLIPDE